GSRHLRDQNKIQHSIPPALFPSSREVYRSLLRSNNCSDRSRFCHKLSATPSTCQIHRYRKQPSVCFSDQQLRIRCHHRNTTLQRTMEDRTLLQMDQTTSAHKSIFWNFAERRQDTDLDCGLDLCSHGHYQKTSRLDPRSLHNFTSFKRYDIRENTYLTSTYNNG